MTTGARLKSAVLVAACATLSLAGSSNAETLTARFTANGVLDNTFTSQGFVAAGSAGFLVEGVAVRSGKVIAGGFLVTSDGTAAMLIGRYKNDGSADPTFGWLGAVSTTVPGGGESRVRSLAADGD